MFGGQGQGRGRGRGSLSPMTRRRFKTIAKVEDQQRDDRSIITRVKPAWFLPKVNPATYRVGEWVLVKFPADESGKLRKLARPWHGPYRVTEVNEPNISVSNVYHPKKKTIKIHQSRVKHCPVDFPAGFYWYGGKRKAPGRPPKWVEQLLAGKDADKVVDKEAEIDVTKASTEQRDLTIRNDRTEISDDPMVSS